MAQVRELSSWIQLQLGISLRLKQTFQFVTKVRELSA